MSLWNSLGDSNEELKYHDKCADLLNELFHKVIIDESEWLLQNKNLIVKNKLKNKQKDS